MRTGLLRAIWGGVLALTTVPITASASFSSFIQYELLTSSSVTAQYLPVVSGVSGSQDSGVVYSQENVYEVASSGVNVNYFGYGDNSLYTKTTSETAIARGSLKAGTIGASVETYGVVTTHVDTNGFVTAYAVPDTYASAYVQMTDTMFLGVPEQYEGQDVFVNLTLAIDGFGGWCCDDNYNASSGGVVGFSGQSVSLDGLYGWGYEWADYQVPGYVPNPVGNPPYWNEFLELSLLLRPASEDDRVVGLSYSIWMSLLGADGGDLIFLNTASLGLVAPQGVTFEGSASGYLRNLLAPENTVAEPTVLALFGLGLAGLGAMRRKKLAA